MAARMGEGVEGPRARGNRAKRWRKVVILPGYDIYLALARETIERFGPSPRRVSLQSVVASSPFSESTCTDMAKRTAET
jgi:hypothetical protein